MVSVAGVAGFEPTNDGVRGKLTSRKIAVFAYFLPKNCRFKHFFRNRFPKFPQFCFPNRLFLLYCM